MRGSSLLLLILSFVSFVVSGPSHSTIHSSRLARNPVSSRQFHYPRSLVDVCADVDLSLLLDGALAGLKLSLLGDICLCLSAFPLDLDLYADLGLLVDVLGETEVEARLKTLVQDSGTHCTYPDHASSKCTSENPCGFTCMDGFVEGGDGCICARPNSVCNGKCGSYPNGCSSALPRAPKMARRSITSSHRGGTPVSHSGDLLDLILGGSNPSSDSPSLDLGGLLNGLLNSSGTTSGGSQSSDSGNDLDIDELVDELLKSLGITGPILGGNQSSGLEVDLNVCLGTGISGTQNLLDTITDIVNSLLSSLLGTTIECNVGSSSPALVDPDVISLDLQICGLSGGSLESSLDKILKGVVDSLNDSLDGVTIVTKCNVGGPGCPATPISSSSGQPHHSPPTSAVPIEMPHPSVHTSPSPTPHSGIDLSGLINVTSGQVEEILGSLGLSSGNYSLDTDVDLIVGVLVGLSDTLSSTGGLVSAITALVGETLDSLLGTDITTQPNSSPASSPTPSNPGQGDGIVVDIDLNAVINAALSNTSDIVEGVLSAVSGVLAYCLPDLDVVVNVDSGPSCGCSGSRKASAKG